MRMISGLQINIPICTAGEGELGLNGKAERERQTPSSRNEDTWNEIVRSVEKVLMDMKLI